MRELPLPPPLPSETRPVGQLVAESIRFYADRFWPALLLGLPVAAVAELNFDRGIVFQLAMYGLAAPFMSAAFVFGCMLVLEPKADMRRQLFAWAVGTLIWLPVAPLLRLYVLPALVWLAFWGLAVPIVLVEGTGFVGSLRRAHRLARADFVHALGTLCTLVLLVHLTGQMMQVLLHSSGDATQRTAAFLAPLVLSPMFYIGSAFLYRDQAARAV